MTALPGWGTHPSQSWLHSVNGEESGDQGWNHHIPSQLQHSHAVLNAFKLCGVWGHGWASQGREVLLPGWHCLEKMGHGCGKTGRESSWSRKMSLNVQALPLSPGPPYPLTAADGGTNTDSRKSRQMGPTHHFPSCCWKHFPCLLCSSSSQQSPGHSHQHKCMGQECRHTWHGRAQADGDRVFWGGLRGAGVFPGQSKVRSGSEEGVLVQAADTQHPGSEMPPQPHSFPGPSQGYREAVGMELTHSWPSLWWLKMHFCRLSRVIRPICSHISREGEPDNTSRRHLACGIMLLLSAVSSSHVQGCPAHLAQALQVGHLRKACLGWGREGTGVGTTLCGP